MPSQKRKTSRSSSEENAVEKYTPKNIEGCSTCPPTKACVGPEITFETSGCLDGGGSFNLRDQTDQVIPFHVECPGDGKLKITTSESLNGGGEFTANQACSTNIDLDINNVWLDRFVLSRIGNGSLNIEGDMSINGGTTFKANQENDANCVLKVNWGAMPVNSRSLSFESGELQVKESFTDALKDRISILEVQIQELRQFLQFQ